MVRDDSATVWSEVALSRNAMHPSGRTRRGRASGMVLGEALASMLMVAALMAFMLIAGQRPQESQPSNAREGRGAMRSMVVYVHMSPGGPVVSPDGSPERPYPDFTAALSLAASGTPVTIKAAGLGRVYNTSPAALLSLSAAHSGRVTVEAWEDPDAFGWDAIPPTLYGGVVANAFGAADAVYTNCYRVDGLGRKPAGVACGWLTRTTASGERTGWYQQRATLAACDANPGSWYWDAPNSRLYVHAENSQNLLSSPTIEGHTIEWFRPGDGIRINSCSNITIRGVRVWATPDEASSQGVGIKVANSTDITIEDCEIVDSGYHSWATPGGPATRIVFRRVTAVGCGPSVDSYGVFFANAGAHVEECLAVDCHAAMRPLLRWDSTDEAPIAITDTAGNIPHQLAYSAHSGNGGSLIALKGATFMRCTSRIVYPGKFGACRFGGFANGSDCVAPPDLADLDEYPIRYIECDLECTNSYVGTDGPAYIALINTRIYAPDSDDVGGQAGTNAVIGVSTSSSIPAVLAAKGSVIIGRSATASGSLVRVTHANKVLDYNNTWIVLGGTGAIFNRTGPQQVIGRQSSYYHGGSDVRKLFTGSSTTTNPGVDINYGVYGNFTSYGVGSASDSLAEWRSLQDSNGHYIVDAGNVNLLTGEPKPGSFLRRVRTAHTPYIEKGINGRAWDGHYGAFQYLGANPIINRTSFRKVRPAQEQ